MVIKSITITKLQAETAYYLVNILTQTGDASAGAATFTLLSATVIVVPLLSHRSWWKNTDKTKRMKETTE